MLTALLLAGVALVALGLWLDWRWAPTDTLAALLLDDAEWDRVIAAVEGEDWALWEAEVRR